MTLAERIAEAKAKAQAIVDKVEAEDRDWTAEEVDAFNDHMTEVGSLTTRLERAQQVGTAAAVLDAPRPRVPAADPAADDPAAAGPRIKVNEPNFMKDPCRGFARPRDFLLSVMDITVGKPVHTDTRDKLFSLRPTGQFQAAVGSDEQMGINDPYGGFLLPTGFSPQLLTVGVEPDPFNIARTTGIPMENPRVVIPARVDKTHTTSVSGGLTVSRSAETVAKTASRMEFEQVVLNATSIFGLAYATEELLTDSPISFVAIIEAGFRDEFNGHLINERLNGTGVGEFLGINNSGCLIAQAKVSGQTATTFTYQNAVEMRARCWGYQNAVWFANHDVFPQLALSESSGGQIIWQPSIRDDRPDMLLGRPIIFTEYCETLGSQGDVILGNWTQYLEGTYQPLQQAESIHVRFTNHERAFKFWMRNAGTPWWRSALTVKKGSNSLSPFVALAVRA